MISQFWTASGRRISCSARVSGFFWWLRRISLSHLQTKVCFAIWQHKDYYCYCSQCNVCECGRWQKKLLYFSLPIFMAISHKLWCSEEAMYTTTSKHFHMKKLPTARGKIRPPLIRRKMGKFFPKRICKSFLVQKFSWWNKRAAGKNSKFKNTEEEMNKKGFKHWVSGLLFIFLPNWICRTSILKGLKV